MQDLTPFIYLQNMEEAEENILLIIKCIEKLSKIDVNKATFDALRKEFDKLVVVYEVIWLGF